MAPIWAYLSLAINAIFLAYFFGFLSPPRKRETSNPPNNRPNATSERALQHKPFRCPKVLGTSLENEGIQCLEFYDHDDIAAETDLHIRLLELNAKDARPLSCTMRTVPMNKETFSFCALSYYWGEGPMHSIEIENDRHRTRAVIRQNLYDALNAFRNRGIYTVWVDALCLNQFCLHIPKRLDTKDRQDESSIEELASRSRTEQNRMLPEVRRIYWKAECTYAWLGKHAGGSESVFTTLKLRREFLSESHGSQPYTFQEIEQVELMVWQDLKSSSQVAHNRFHSSHEDSAYKEVRDEVTLFCGMAIQEHVNFQRTEYEGNIVEITRETKRRAVKEDLISMLALFERPFWRRKWIIQELASARKVVFCCSLDSADDDLSWVDFAGPIGAVLRQAIPEESFSILRTDDPKRIGLRNFLLLIHITDMVQSARPLHLFYLLRESAGFGASNILDYILPLRALAFDADLHIPVPGYGLKDQDAETLRRMLLDMSVHRIIRTKNLDSICLTCDEQHAEFQAHIKEGKYEFEDLPSWAPNWIAPSEYGDRFLDYFCGHDRRPGLNRISHKWHASGDSSWQGGQGGSDGFLSEGHSGVDVLRAHGVCIGEIDGIIYNPTSYFQRNNVGDLVEHRQTTEMDRRIALYDNWLAQGVFLALSMHRHAYVPTDENLDLRFLWDKSFQQAYTAKKVNETIAAFQGDTVMIEQAEAPWISFWAWIDQIGEVSLHGKLIVHRMESSGWQLTNKTSSEATASQKRLSRRPWKRRREEEQRMLQEHQEKTDQQLQEFYDEIRKTEVIEAVQKIYDDDEMSFITVQSASQADQQAVALGWAHPKASPGDAVFLLDGCSVPVILRPAPPSSSGTARFRVIGDAWIHGAMDGSVWQSYKKSERKVFNVVEIV